MGKLIPARYIGEHEILLSKHNGPYLAGDGLPLRDLHLSRGDIMMMNEEEVNGHTLLTDPKRDKDPVHLGVGRVVLKEHEGKTFPELLGLGYQFHEGRRDFEAVEVAPAPARRNNAKEAE